MKKLSEYQAIIIDMDGTLYYQRPVRMAMLIEMLLHFWRIRELRIVQQYRRLFEQGLDEQRRLAQLPENAPQIIHEWMIDRPLKYIGAYRDAVLIDLMMKTAADGNVVIVCSDYPVKEKLGVIGFSPDYSFTANELGTMKPNSTALINALSLLSIDSNHCLVIGDRYVKDGKMAEGMGADYIILPGTKTERERYYREEITL